MVQTNHRQLLAKPLALGSRLPRFCPDELTLIEQTGKEVEELMEATEPAPDLLHRVTR